MGRALNIFFGMFGALFGCRKGVSIHMKGNVCLHIYGMEMGQKCILEAKYSILCRNIATYVAVVN